MRTPANKEDETSDHAKPTMYADQPQLAMVPIEDRLCQAKIAHRQ